MTPEEKSAYKRRWRAANLERIKKRNADYYRKNKDTILARNRAWVENNPDHAKKIKREWKNNNPRRQMFTRAKLRAQKEGREFSISLEDIVIPEICPALGIPLTWGKDFGKTGPGNMTLDRVDNRKGYVKGNVQVISWRANALKRDATLEELQNLVLYVKKQSLSVS